MDLLKRLSLAAAIGAAAIALLARILPPNGQSAHLPGVLVYAILCEIMPLLIGAYPVAVAVGVSDTPCPGSDTGTEDGHGHERRPRLMPVGRRLTRVTLQEAAFVVAASIARWAVLSAAALLGGTLIAAALGLAPVGLGLERVIGAVSVSRAALGLAKAGAFGLLIALCPAGHRLLACVLLEASVVAALVAAGDLTRWLAAPPPFVIYAISGDGYGATVGSPVKVHGVEIGHVTEVALVHDVDHQDTPVRLTLKVSDLGASFLKEQTVAHVERIQLGPGVPPFATAQIALSTAGQAPLRTGALVELVGDETMGESFAQLAHEFTAVRKQIDDLHGVFDAAERLLRDPSTTDDIPALIHDARAATRDLRALIVETRKVSARTPLAIDAIESASREGQGLIAKLDRAALDFPRILASTERTLALAEDIAADLRAAAREAPALARSTSAAIEEADRALTAAERSVLLRGTLPARPTPRRAAEVRPPLPLPVNPP